MAGRAKTIFQNLLLAGAALLAALLISELISRLAFDAVDFLRPRLVTDPLLGHAVEPGSGAHDAWGFRNRRVPPHADIVTIGDSQTYGVSAPAKESWPAVLGELSGLEVYNLSLGGYGPVQYLHLLTTQAIRLKPSVVIVGFYLGNDLLETYEIVHDNPQWGHLKGLGSAAPANRVASIAAPTPAATPSPFLDGLRTWLAQHSVIYNILIYSLVGELARIAEAALVSKGSEDDSRLRYEKNGVQTGFTPAHRLQALDLQHRRVREGLRISLDLFARMKAFCAERAIHLLVVLIPTKESVYGDYLENDRTLEASSPIRRLLSNERRVRDTVLAFLAAHDIARVDPLPKLREAVAELQLYPGNFDGHPNGNGYRVIAAEVERYLRAVAPAAAPGELATALPTPVSEPAP